MSKIKIKSIADWGDLAEAINSTAHPERLAIFHLMCNWRCNRIVVKNIYSSFHLEQSITSRHLSIMRKSGVRKREVREGKTFYHFIVYNPTAKRIKNLLTE